MKLLLNSVLLLLFVQSCTADTHYLRQSDFDYGTIVIREPGTYILEEDVAFNPFPPGVDGRDAYSAGRPTPEQLDYQTGIYDQDAFRLGFFAAIAVACEDVTIDLNGKTLSQSHEHALLQRFFAVIELADRPFIFGQGPNDFGQVLRAARRFTLRNGVLGRSAHHGIHGNGNQDVLIENVNFVDWEVAAVALNGVNRLTIRNCFADNFKAVPILGTFSAARFITPYVNWIAEYSPTTTLNIHGQQKTAVEIRDNLRNAINNIHGDVITRGLGFIDEVAHPDEYATFHNKFGLVDGNGYAFLLNNLGIAVNGFPAPPSAGFTKPSSEIVMDDIHVGNISGFINEIPALNAGSTAVIDPVGSVLQLFNKHPVTHGPVTVTSLDNDGEYVGSSLSDAQLLVAQSFFEGSLFPSGLDTSRMNIALEVLDWVAAPSGSDKAKIGDLLEDYPWVCNGDTMFHVNKGMIAFKIDATVQARLTNITIDEVNNFGEPGVDLCEEDYADDGKSHPLATLLGYGGDITRAFSFSGSTHVELDDVNIGKVYAKGVAVGVDTHVGSSKISMNDVKIVSAESESGQSIGFRFAKTVQRVARNTLTDYCCGDGVETCVEDEVNSCLRDPSSNC